MTKFKSLAWSLAWAVAALFVPGFLFAQESGTIDTSQVAQIGNHIKSAVSDASSTISPILTSIILAGLALWLIITLPGIFKRAWTAGKGR